ncbi:hypothetical protein J422_06441 [Methanocaldococcus villosus KIN24-T80]|uniref:DUF447 family protein n=1 Tax=Methanocaldococcus villosus KIN24-T80 TaxID=1069083 RepID=N6V070_9EURY|nr:DUF447 domain-containing protein [Methanocaldococcus villosus]ENN95703.1 hypothetical protein J422_06441 [Methanocaldococcus villosus KIN24-T80]
MIYEAVVCTKNNKAPIGVSFKDNYAILRLFYGSHTYNNLLKENYFSVNIVDPIELVKALITDEDDYKYYKDIPYIDRAYLSIFYKVTERKFLVKRDIYGESKLMIIKGKEIGRICLNKKIKPYCRADGLLVEMAIIYSRLNHIKDDKKEEFKKDMEKYYGVIKKVGSEEHKKLAKILIENFKH